MGYFPDPSYYSGNKADLLGQTFIQTHIFGSGPLSDFSAEKKGEHLHFKLKATVATWGSTCLPYATSKLTEMAPFAYSLCGIALRLGNTMPARDC